MKTDEERELQGVYTARRRSSPLNIRYQNLHTGDYEGRSKSSEPNLCTEEID